MRAAVSARESSTRRTAVGRISPLHGTHTRTAPAPTDCSRRTTVSGNGVHLSVSSSTPTMSGSAGCDACVTFQTPMAMKRDGDGDAEEFQSAAGDARPRNDCLSTRQPVAMTVRRYRRTERSAIHSRSCASFSAIEVS